MTVAINMYAFIFCVKLRGKTVNSYPDAPPPAPTPLSEMLYPPLLNLEAAANDF